MVTVRATLSASVVRTGYPGWGGRVPFWVVSIVKTAFRKKPQCARARVYRGACVGSGPAGEQGTRRAGGAGVPAPPTIPDYGHGYILVVQYASVRSLKILSRCTIARWLRKITHNTELEPHGFDSCRGHTSEKVAKAPAPKRKNRTRTLRLVALSSALGARLGRWAAQAVSGARRGDSEAPWRAPEGGEVWGRMAPKLTTARKPHPKRRRPQGVHKGPLREDARAGPGPAPQQWAAARAWGGL
jgi:hypothetical protein